MEKFGFDSKKFFKKQEEVEKQKAENFGKAMAEANEDRIWKISFDGPVPDEMKKELLQIARDLAIDSLGKKVIEGVMTIEGKQEEVAEKQKEIYLDLYNTVRKFQTSPDKVKDEVMSRVQEIKERISDRKAKEGGGQ